MHKAKHSEQRELAEPVCVTTETRQLEQLGELVEPVCVRTEARHFDWLGQLGELEPVCATLHTLGAFSLTELLRQFSLSVSL